MDGPVQTSTLSQRACNTGLIILQANLSPISGASTFISFIYICVILKVRAPCTRHKPTRKYETPFYSQDTYLLILRMNDQDTKRLSRLIAILTQLQTKRLLTSTTLADKFGVSIRTIYRDIRALEQAGIPIVTEEGKGYSLMDGYRVPPVMFTEAQVNALITAEQLVLKNKDTSFIKDYIEAIDKIKAVLKYNIQDKANLLSARTQFDQNIHRERSSHNLSELQAALTNFYLLKIEYTNEQEQTTTRYIEPFALISTENWLLIAYCRLRKEFRFFRLDRIKKLEVLPDKFEPHGMSLQEYFDKYH